jgi:hypothetical protein
MCWESLSLYLSNVKLITVTWIEKLDDLFYSLSVYLRSCAHKNKILSQLKERKHSAPYIAGHIGSTTNSPHSQGPQHDIQWEGTV